MDEKREAQKMVLRLRGGLSKRSQGSQEDHMKFPREPRWAQAGSKGGPGVGDG